MRLNKLKTKSDSDSSMIFESSDEESSSVKKSSKKKQKGDISNESAHKIEGRYVSRTVTAGEKMSIQTKNLNKSIHPDNNLKHTFTSNTTLKRTVSKIVDSSSNGSTVMLSQYRWLSKQQQAQGSKFKAIENNLNEDIKDDSSVSSDISVNSSNYKDKHSSHDEGNGLVKNMKYVNRLRRNSLLKNTLLGRILNMKARHSISFIDQESMKSQIRSLPKINPEIEEIISCGEKSSISENWDENNQYEHIYNDNEDYSPYIHLKNTENNKEKELKEKREKKTINQYLMVRSSRVNEPIDEESDEENVGDVNLNSFQKLKSLERRSTPQAVKRSKLEETKNVNIKKSSTDLAHVIIKNEQPETKYK